MQLQHNDAASLFKKLDRAWRCGPTRSWKDTISFLRSAPEIGPFWSTPRSILLFGEESEENEVLLGVIHAFSPGIALFQDPNTIGGVEDRIGLLERTSDGWFRVKFLTRYQKTFQPVLSISVTGDQSVAISYLHIGHPNVIFHNVRISPDRQETLLGWLNKWLPLDSVPSEST